ncbi:uncharacterized protein LOC129218097 [Uloborus diversus]|uniref:uncharacterized protein LOC129218097 n=1 Tax=Uloborus diversus TaxID=327109 RepID=UPI002409256F|nr:uncharacterized protein LOC129218097 [Uloborus diversus]
MKTTSFIILLSAVAITRCQFVYNYEEDQREEPANSQVNEASLYQYNPPSAVNEQYLPPARSTELATQSVVRFSEPKNSSRQRQSRSRSSTVTERQPESSVPPPEPSESDEQRIRQERRQNRRRQRQNLRNFVESSPAPKIYSPSAFEKIGLGEAPSGVYVPHDSPLNSLRASSHRNNAPFHVPAPEIPLSTRNYIEPSVAYQNNELRENYFVQPPSSNRNPSQPSVQYVAPLAMDNRHQNVANLQMPRQAASTSQQRPQGSSAQHVFSSQPTVDVSSYRGFVNNVPRENVEPEPSKEVIRQARPEIAVVQPRQMPVQNPRNQVSLVDYYQSPTRPRVYSPSIFENVALGEAPNGVHVPQDSLLNLLKDPSQRSRASLPEPQQDYYRQQPKDNAEGQSQYDLPLPADDVMSPPRRQSVNRNRQMRVPTSSNQSQRPSYKVDNSDEFEHSFDVPRRSSGEGRNSNRRRVNVSVREHRMESPQRSEQERPTRRSQNGRPLQRSQQERPPQRTSSQGTSSSRKQSSFKPAKLAVAELPPDTDGDEIPGEAGTDYPTLHTIPKTTFSCSQQDHNGYYADLETSCQVMHLCQSGGVQNSFLCPNGTIFSQEKFSCQWWYKVNCADSPRFYAINDNLYKVPEKKDRKKD